MQLGCTRPLLAIEPSWMIRPRQRDTGGSHFPPDLTLRISTQRHKFPDLGERCQVPVLIGSQDLHHRIESLMPWQATSLVPYGCPCSSFSIGGLLGGWLEAPRSRGRW
jgi:hypothetical protein